MVNPRIQGLKPLEFAELGGGAEAPPFRNRHSQRDFATVRARVATGTLPNRNPRLRICANAGFSDSL